MIKSKKILLTGAAGFMGSHLMDYLIKKGYDVIGVDDFSGGFRRNIKDGWDFHELDLSNRELVKQFIDYNITLNPCKLFFNPLFFNPTARRG